MNILLDEQQAGGHLPFFLNTLNAGALNAYVICTEKNQGQMSTNKDRQRKFLSRLGKELAFP
jgi:hypothetical protein